MQNLPIVAEAGHVLAAQLTPAAQRALDVTPEELVQRWIAALSPSCARAYSLGVRTFTKWAMGEEAHPTVALRLIATRGPAGAHSLLDDWRQSMLDAGRATGTVAVYVSAVASLLKAARRAGIIGWQVEGVRPKVEQRIDRSGPRDGEVDRLLAVVEEAAEAGSAQAMRDSAMLHLLYFGGFRRSEVLSLTVADLELAGDDGATVRARRKGKRERQAKAIDPRAVVALRRWLAVRGEHAGPVFVSVKHAERFGGQALSGEALRRVLATWAKRAKIKRPVRPHGLRHSGATTIARRNGSIAELMAYGGWVSPSSAARYLDESQQDRRSAMRLL